jgi:hypothetical protein
MTPCPHCDGSGAEKTAHADACGLQVFIWCRECYGTGLVRIPDEDDEQEQVELLWPESIRWKHRA